MFPFKLPDDPSRPVLCALSRACTDNWEAFFDTVTKLGAQLDRPPEERLSEADAVQMMETAIPCIKNVVEILRWISYRRPLSIEEACQKAQVFRELGDDWEENMFSLLQKFPQGKPPRRRASHIKAFEFMLLSKKNSMGLAVKKFCPCGGSHGPKCRVNLKAGIHVLTKMLRNYAPELVAQYHTMHPDRNRGSRSVG